MAHSDDDEAAATAGEESDGEDVDVEGSEGYESPGGPEELPGVPEEQGGDQAQRPPSSSGSSGSSSSDASDEEDGSDGGGGEDENDADDDLFGPQNEDYTRTTAQSPHPLPRLPPLPSRNDDFRRGGRGGHNKGGDRNSFPGSGALLSQSQPAYFSFKSRDLLVADLKLGPVGHQDETLRISCPPFQEPQQISCYSRTADGEVHYDDRCLRKFRRSILYNPGGDLNQGFETYVEKKEGSESSGFGDLLACIRASNIPLENIHFVTFRNNLNKILGTTYNRRDPWEMGVHKRRGTVYLDVHKLPEAPPTELQQRSCYWGYKFEQIATEGSNETSGDEMPAVVDANVEFCTVVRTKLGPHRIIMGAEIDCYHVGSDNKKRYAELKTSRELDPRTVERFEKDKLLKFWIQSFLAGVPRIVCGYRDDDGRLLRTEMMGTQEIAHRMKQKHYWEGGVCLAFADRILCWLYGSVKDDGDYVLRFLPTHNRLELWKDDSCPAVIVQHVEHLT